MSALLTPHDIERLAAERGKTLREVCEQAGIARTTFTRWKGGVTSPSIDVYARLVAAVSAPSKPDFTTPPQLAPEVVGA